MLEVYLVGLEKAVSASSPAFPRRRFSKGCLHTATRLGRPLLCSPSEHLPGLQSVEAKVPVEGVSNRVTRVREEGAGLGGATRRPGRARGRGRGRWQDAGWAGWAREETVGEER